MTTNERLPCGEFIHQPVDLPVGGLDRTLERGLDVGDLPRGRPLIEISDEDQSPIGLPASGDSSSDSLSLLASSKEDSQQYCGHRHDDVPHDEPSQ